MADIIGLYKGISIEDFVAGIALPDKQENFLYNQEAIVDSLDKNKLITHIACTLVKFLPSDAILVGVDIKAPARSRDLRIPLVTLSNKKITIWKSCFEIPGLDKTALVLEEISDVISHISSLGAYTIHKAVLFPKRSIVTADNEDYFSTKLDKDRLQSVFAEELIDDLKEGSYSNLIDIINVEI